MRSSGQVSRAYAGRSFDGKKLSDCMGVWLRAISAGTHCKIMQDRNACGHENFWKFHVDHNMECKMCSACPVFPRLEKPTA